MSNKDQFSFKLKFFIISTFVLGISVILIGVLSVQRMMQKDRNYDMISDSLRECYDKPSTHPWRKGGKVLPVMVIFNESDMVYEDGVNIYSSGPDTHIVFFEDLDEALEYISQKVGKHGYYSKALVYNLTPISVKLIKEESTLIKEINKWVVDE
jgi:hypothetical protein